MKLTEYQIKQITRENMTLKAHISEINSKYEENIKYLKDKISVLNKENSDLQQKIDNVDKEINSIVNEKLSNCLNHEIHANSIKYKDKITALEMSINDLKKQTIELKKLKNVK